MARGPRDEGGGRYDVHVCVSGAEPGGQCTTVTTAHSLSSSCSSMRFIPIGLLRFLWGCDGLASSSMGITRHLQYLQTAAVMQVAKSSLAAAASSSKMELPPSAQFVVSRNGVKLPWHRINNRCEGGEYPSSGGGNSDSDTPMSAATLLQVLSRGAYTTCRTIDHGRRVYLFDFHVNRIDDSTQRIFVDDLDRSHAEAWSRDSIRDCVRSTIRYYRETYYQDEAGSADFRIVLLATLEENPLSRRGESKEGVLYCHVGELSKRSDTEHIRVLIQGRGRENAEAKDSKWILDRKRLITPESASYEEIILLNENGELLEGTQTNFYVVRDEALITADEGILLGSVRDSVLRVCRCHNVNVELRPPTMDDLKHASGVFISSTSRLVMPVHNVVLGDLIQGDSDASGECARCYHYRNCRITERIKEWVLRDVETHSTLIET